MSAAAIAGLDALLLRAESATAALAGEAKTAAAHQFWTGYAKALRDLQDGVGDKLARRDALGARLQESPLRAVRISPASDDLACNPGYVSHKSVGIEFQPLGFAPFGEIALVKVYADAAQPFDLPAFAGGLGCSKLLLVGPMEFVTVLETEAAVHEGLAPPAGGVL